MKWTHDTVIAMPELGKKDIDGFRQRLIDERAELARLAEGHEEDGQAVELDQQRLGRLSRMDALQGQAMAKELERRRDVELQRIDAALKRLDEDEFGYCVSCGEEVSRARLDADPTTPTCIDCAK
jgi:DnaK suppressor protein